MADETQPAAIHRQAHQQGRRRSPRRRMESRLRRLRHRNDGVFFAAVAGQRHHRRTEKRPGDYFAPTSLSLSRSGAGGVLAGRTFAPDGARIGEGAPPQVIAEIGPPPVGAQVRQPTDEEIADLVAEREQAAFDAAEASLNAALAANPDIAALRDNVLVDITPAGLRIQLVDKEGGSMFAAGGATMPARTRALLNEITKVIAALPNDLSIFRPHGPGTFWRRRRLHQLGTVVGSGQCQPPGHNHIWVSRRPRCARSWARRILNR